MKAGTDDTPSLILSSNVDYGNNKSARSSSDAASLRDPSKGYCKSAMLDQVLGVVDGACHRINTMDLALGGIKSTATATTTGSTPGTLSRSLTSNPPEWGVAPSDDEDDSTCLDTNTMGDTMGGTTTQYTKT